MNKLRLSFLKSLGGVISEGDVTSFGEIYSTADFHLLKSLDYKLSEIFINSFAPRNNTGEQPMPDGFPVVAYMRSINMLAIDWHWSIENNPVDIATWKPDIDALIALQDEHDKAMPTFSKVVDKAEADFTGSTFSAGYMEAVKAGFTFDKFCKAGVDFNKAGKDAGVVTDPAKIAECFERDQEEYDKQLDNVASKLRNAGYFVQMDALLFMQQGGLLNDLTNKVK